MQLINARTKEILVVFEPSGVVNFKDDMLFRQLVSCGIKIPEADLEKYNNRTIVFPGTNEYPEMQKLFKQAFIEIYFVELQESCEDWQWQVVSN